MVGQATGDWTYVNILPGLVLVGIGAGLAMPAVSGSVLGSLPRAEVGVGSATNGTAMQLAAR